jgi:PTS system nitrogen regulatory IIA component
MHVTNLLTPDRIVCNVALSSKKRVLEHLSMLIADSSHTFIAAEIFDSLIARERLGSTGLGHGIAIPHGRVKNSEETIGAFIKLQEGIDYDAIDNQPVDLFFALLVPENSTDEHLQLLSQLATIFRDESLRQRLRESNSSEEILELITQAQP